MATSWQLPVKGPTISIEGPYKDKVQVLYNALLAIDPIPNPYTFEDVVVTLTLHDGATPSEVTGHTRKRLLGLVDNLA